MSEVLLPPQSPWQRQPKDIPQPESNACLSCVVTNIMFAAGEVGADWTVADTDKMLGREPEQKIHPDTVILKLLEKGYSVRALSDWDNDRFIQEGRSYLEEYYGDGWHSAGQSEYWTPEMVLERQAASAANEAIFAPHKSQIDNVVKAPDLSDIDGLLADGCFALVESVGTTSYHANLVFGTTSDSHGEAYEIYIPTREVEGAKTVSILSVDKDHFAEYWDTRSGLIGIKPPTSSV